MDQDQKFYKWEPDTQFVLNGKQFSVLYNIVDTLVGTPRFQEKLYEAQETMNILSLSQMLKEKINEESDKGNITLITKEEQEAMINKSLQEQQNLVDSDTSTN